MTAATPPLLRVSGLSRTFGTGPQAVHAVRDVSFETRLGEFIAIVGPSGSGKTTLLAMLGGLLSPTAGSILVGGREVTTLTDRARARYRRDDVGFVFQANNLLPFLTARENLLVIRAIGGIRDRDGARRADQLLEELGLMPRKDALATQLSGGERQRVAIGRALMNDPLLVLVDEPTASLDSQRGQAVVQRLLEEVKGRQKLGIMVTHDPAMAALTDRVLEMHDGSLVNAR
jgi:putative ABC transport system ATP-binding protein